VAALVPGSRVVGEEAVEADPSLLEGLEGGVAWLLDPVDGTSNFARGGGTLSIAAAAPNEGIRAVHLLNDIHHLTTAEGSFVSH
jgi:fructose-1,6-bisphosphatase/inositol monophosphatase family enzyme